MDKFTTLTGIAAYLPLVNVDTDMIIPKQFLKTVERTGLGVHLFDEMRYDDNGNEISDFVLNQEPYRNAKILVSLDNFGCGSSREHAPWALLDFGIKCVIAPSFADIFHNNCFKNGILPIRLDTEEVKRIAKDAEDKKEVTVNLKENKIKLQDGSVIKFDLDEFRRHCLLEGLDDISLTLQHSDKIDAYEEKRRKELPWLYKEVS